ncbi:hypothetical protein OG552_32615 [Streptomyces sp. NBC_01476]|uniref:hypothetical protein n=1 Tax=Streptomyces sp. NBC_01476 TaxID=2903881 RepID=UPI002E360CE6|nr:hypothetical protein [Streptomyces sp. NBC_01476]
MKLKRIIEKGPLRQGVGDAPADALGEPEADAEAEDEAEDDGDAEPEGAALVVVAEGETDAAGDVDDPPSAWAAVAVSNAAGTSAAVAAAADMVRRSFMGEVPRGCEKASVVRRDTCV